MLKIFNKFMTSGIILSIMLTILGITLIVIPKTYLNIISTIISIILILHGISMLTLNSKQKQYNPIIIDNITNGILTIILGVIILIYPKIISSIIPICLGVLFIINGSSKIRISLLLKEENNKWIIALILAILSIICGLILIFNPFASAVTLTKIIGIIIIIYSLSDVIGMIILKKDINGIVKHVKKSFKELD